jgi:hypothetical protein
MTWLICIIGGLLIGVLCSLASIFSRWAEEARKAGAYKR